MEEVLAGVDAEVSVVDSLVVLEANASVLIVDLESLIN
jgi:hypothetical protein